MSYYTFKRLATSLLCPGIVLASGKKEGSRNHLRNGPILPEVLLACALLRWFAGGSIYDIMTRFGISHTDAQQESCRYIVDAVNAQPSLTILYPHDHEEQHSIARGFSQVSAANFGCCAGVIDGILIWIHKPLLKDWIEAGCNAWKSFCGQKHKFGLNCQTVGDARNKILDLSILYPASTSDILAFEGTSLFHKLEDVCLLQDCVYLATTHTSIHLT